VAILVKASHTDDVLTVFQCMANLLAHPVFPLFQSDAMERIAGADQQEVPRALNLLQ
jgi:hypothetical protein